MKKIAKCALDSFDAHIEGHFLGTAHNEIEAKWDYVKAWNNGWINTTALPENTTLVDSTSSETELKFMQD